MSQVLRRLVDGYEPDYIGDGHSVHYDLSGKLKLEE